MYGKKVISSFPFPRNEIEYTNRLKTKGIWRECFATGKIYKEGACEKRFNNGDFNYEGWGGHGEWNYFYPNGQLKQISFYKDDKNHGPCATWHQNGNIRSEGNFENNKMDGIWTWYRKDGKKYLEDIKNIKKKTWTKIGYHPNGRKKFKVEVFSENPLSWYEMMPMRRNGLDICWDEKGTIIAEGASLPVNLISHSENLSRTVRDFHPRSAEQLDGNYSIFDFSNFCDRSFGSWKKHVEKVITEIW